MDNSANVDSASSADVPNLDSTARNSDGLDADGVGSDSLVEEVSIDGMCGVY